MPVPAHLDWYIWRVVRSNLCSGLAEINDWSLDDLADAHDVLDIEDEIAAQKAE